jgi:hypothetical protein
MGHAVQLIKLIENCSLVDDKMGSCFLKLFVVTQLQLELHAKGSLMAVVGSNILWSLMTGSILLRGCSQPDKCFVLPLPLLYAAAACMFAMMMQGLC